VTLPATQIGGETRLHLHKDVPKQVLHLTGAGGVTTQAVSHLQLSIIRLNRWGNADAICLAVLTGGERGSRM